MPQVEIKRAVKKEEMAGSGAGGGGYGGGYGGELSQCHDRFYITTVCAPAVALGGALQGWPVIMARSTFWVLTMGHLLTEHMLARAKHSMHSLCALAWRSLASPSFLQPAPVLLEIAVARVDKFCLCLSH